MNELQELLLDLQSPAIALELAGLALCLALAAGLSWALGRGATARGSILFGRRLIDGVLFPALALVFTYGLKLVLLKTQRVSVLKVALPVLVSLVVIRLIWRRNNPAPRPLGGGWEAKLATATHHALYLFLFLAPLAGYLASSFTPYAIKFFGFEIPKAGWPDESLNSLFKLLHVVFVWGGAGLIALHVAGAIKHVLQRDGTLQRMLPGKLFKN